MKHHSHHSNDDRVSDLALLTATFLEDSDSEVVPIESAEISQADCKFVEIPRADCVVAALHGFLESQVMPLTEDHIKVGLGMFRKAVEALTELNNVCLPVAKFLLEAAIAFCSLECLCSWLKAMFFPDIL